MTQVDVSSRCRIALDSCRTIPGRTLLREWIHSANAPRVQRQSIHACLYPLDYNHEAMMKIVATLDGLVVPEYQADVMSTSATKAQRYCEHMTVTARTAIALATRLASYGEPWVRWNRRSMFTRLASITSLVPLQPTEEAQREADLLGGELVVRWNNFYVSIQGPPPAPPTLVLVIDQTPRRSVVTTEKLEQLSSTARRIARRGIEIENECEREYWCPLAASVAGKMASDIGVLQNFARACAVADATVAWRTHETTIMSSASAIERLVISQALLTLDNAQNKEFAHFVIAHSASDLTRVMKEAIYRQEWAVEASFQVSSVRARDMLTVAGASVGFGFFDSQIYL